MIFKNKERSDENKKLNIALKKEFIHSFLGSQTIEIGTQRVYN